MELTVINAFDEMVGSKKRIRIYSYDHFNEIIFFPSGV